jgi:hypothetical protein
VLAGSDLGDPQRLQDGFIFSLQLVAKNSTKKAGIDQRAYRAIPSKEIQNCILKITTNAAGQTSFV